MGVAMPDNTARSKEAREALKIAKNLSDLYKSRFVDKELRAIAAALLEAEARGIERHLGGYICSCHEGYTSRRMVDPDCRFHDGEEEAVKDAQRLRAEAQQLRASEPNAKGE